jgi:magnesium transporter
VSISLFNPRHDTAFRPVELGALQPCPADGLRWIDFVDATRDDVRRLGDLFDFHPLALEDVHKGQQRPKVDIYEDYFFVVIYALDPSGSERHWEVAIFVTRDAVITVRDHDVPAFETAIRRFIEHCQEQKAPTSAMLLYTIADSIVDDYFPCMDAIAEEIDQLEEGMFDSPDRDELRAIFRLRQRLLAMRRVVAPARDVFNALTRRELPLLGEQSLYHFQDVYDHVIRVTDAIDADRDMLASALDVHLSIAANRMNQTVRTLTAASIVLMSLALVAGIYGMNFHLTPSFDSSWAFAAVLGFMAVLAAALAALFRRLGWW